MVKEKLKQYALDPENPILNFELGLCYYSERHLASALNFFLRAAELTKDDELAYKCLIYCSNCLYNQGNRLHSTTGFILQAMALIPSRPEAWFLYLRILENKGEWQECYTFACNSLETCNFESAPFDLSEYPGKHAILFIKSKTAFKLGRGQESRIILQGIVDNHWDGMSESYKVWIQEDIIRLGVGPSSVAVVKYDTSKLKNFKFPFNHIDRISSNFSQTYQDMFILSVLKGKESGTYLEIGAGDPFSNNNTALLESFNWKGSSIEIDPQLVSNFNSHRKNLSYCFDATKVDYRKFIKERYQENIIDYLQVDCEPAKTTFEVLLSIPFDEFKFRVITYEHDYSIDMTRSYREKSRRYLKSLGYVLLVNDIGPTDWFSYEDWWIHPDLVDSDIIEKMKSFKSINNVEDYFLYC